VKSSMILARLAALCLASVSLTTVGTAATLPLSSPTGLAVASNGNLYVANNGGNDVLVYNPTHGQIASKTIVEGINHPSAVAFDSQGNLWVANTGGNTVTEYSPTGTQNTLNTVSTPGPFVVAVDAIDDIWVSSYGTLSVYGLDFPNAILTISAAAEGQQAFTGLAMYQGYGAIGTNSEAGVFEVGPFLVTQGINGILHPFPESCFVATFDSAGNLYCGNLDESVIYLTAASSYVYGGTLVTNLGITPSGIAVDKTHGFVYISSASNNEIFVYNTNGDLLTTIK
jgi:DNA-binding beta-propeller fold protein YncE